MRLTCWWPGRWLRLRCEVPFGPRRAGCLLITCNRDDFLAAAGGMPHHGIIILIRRRSRALERAALVRLLDTAGESGLRGNINFA